MSWDGQYYLDVTIPFGSRASSGHMQRVADAVVSILERKGVVAHMYLDDLIVVTDGYAESARQYEIVRAILKELGLPEALDKSQPPSQNVRWLGVDISVNEGTLLIPHGKIEEAIALVDKYMHRRSLSRKQLQSVIGKLLHVAKCVRPARLFVSRLLDTLRGAPRFYINLTAEMKADLKWFKEFTHEWNGVAIFINPAPAREIVADACLTGIGAASDTQAYTYNVAYPIDPINNITEIEAINVAVAVKTFIDESDRGTTVKVYCDNLPAVSVFQSGRGKNRIILEAARAIWMVQAIYQVHIIFEHIPGSHNELADVLSRISTSKYMKDRAEHLVNYLGLTWVHSHVEIIDSVRHILLCRSGTPAPGREGPEEADSGPSTRDQCKPGVGRKGVDKLLLQLLDRPIVPKAIPNMHVSGSPGRQGTGPAYDPEPSWLHQNILQARGGTSSGQQLQGHVGDGGHTSPQGLRKEGETSSAN